MKKLSINNLELSFREIKLYQFKNNLENIFKNYKSKTIAETINRNKYNGRTIPNVPVTKKGPS